MAYRLLILITKLAINALALLVVASMFKGVRFDNTQATISAAVVLALVNTYLRPLVLILTLPINVLTLGLFTVVINALMLKLVISLISLLLNWFLRPDKVQVRVFRG
jgi:putative membrane protein